MVVLLNSWTVQLSSASASEILGFNTLPYQTERVLVRVLAKALLRPHKITA
jgi:hypothetical protein